jgi:hypothetical protein
VSPAISGEIDGAPYDANAEKRERAAELCMTRRGWQKRAL